jgi:hypothetical protein
MALVYIRIWIPKIVQFGDSCGHTFAFSTIDHWLLELEVATSSNESSWVTVLLACRTSR